MRIFAEDCRQVVAESHGRPEDHHEAAVIVEILRGAGDLGKEEHCRCDWLSRHHFDTEQGVA